MHQVKTPKPIKRGDSWRIQVTINGQRIGATRDTAEDCKRWAAAQILEAEANLGQIKSKQKTISLGQCITIYHSKDKRSPGVAKVRSYYRGALERDFEWLYNTQLHQLTPSHFTRWRDQRLESVSSSTVKREAGWLSGVINYAINELYVIDVNPIHRLQINDKSKSIRRRISQSEVDQLIEAAQFSYEHAPVTPKQWVMWAFLLALETGMRRGEILAITSDNLHERYVHLPLTKNGHSRDVPFSTKARDLIKLRGDFKGLLVPVGLDAFKSAYRRIRTQAGLDEVRFHDTRHEAISRLVSSKRVPVETLAKITGHRDIRVLLNTYYNPTADELSDLLE